MTKHKLDEKVEDVLQHYGIKGMKWGVTRSEEQIAAQDGASGGGGGEEDDENFLEEIEDKLEGVMNTIEKKLGNVSDAIKKKGKSMLTSIFGKSKTKLSKAKPDAKTTKRFKDAMKAYDKASPAQRKALKNGYTIKAESSLTKSNSKKSVSKDGKHTYTGYTGKEGEAILEKYKKQGFKKRPKNSKSLAERGYKFKIDRSK